MHHIPFYVVIHKFNLLIFKVFICIIYQEWLKLMNMCNEFKYKIFKMCNISLYVAC